MTLGRQSVTLQIDDLSRKKGSVFELEGDWEVTDLQTFAVYRNGLALDEREYSVSANYKQLKLFSPITSTDDSLEVRSAFRIEPVIGSCVIMNNYKLGLPAKELEAFAPMIGDIIDMSHLTNLAIETGTPLSMDVAMLSDQIDPKTGLSPGVTNKGYDAFVVVDYWIKPEGIYAKGKLTMRMKPYDF